MARVRYTWGPGGVRRGRIWQSSNMIQSDYKWVDRYPIGSVLTSDGEKYDMAMGYAFPGLSYANDYRVDLAGISPRALAGPVLKPGRDGSGGTSDYYFLNYKIYQILDHVTMNTTTGLYTGGKDNITYLNRFHYYMENSATGMTWKMESQTEFGDETSHNFIKPVYSVFAVTTDATDIIVPGDLPGLPAGSYSPNNVLDTLYQPDTVDDETWAYMTELEKYMAAYPAFYEHIVTDGTAKIKVPRKSIVTPKSIGMDSYTGVRGTDRDSTNPKFNYGTVSMVSPFDGDTHNFTNVYQNSGFQWRYSRASSADEYTRDYYVKHTYSSSVQSFAQASLSSSLIAELYGLIPTCSSTTTIYPYYACWFGPIITFNDSGNIAGMSDYFKEGSWANRRWLIYLLNGYELETTNINEVGLV